MKRMTQAAAKIRGAIRAIATAALFAAAGATAPALAVEPVGLVTELAGSARFQRAAGAAAPLATHKSSAGTVALLDEVPAGATLVLEPGASLVVSYTLLGSAFELKGPGRFRAERDVVRALDGAGSVQARTYAEALQVARFAPAGAVQASIVTRGSEPGRVLAGPKGRQLEASARTIRWRPLGEDWRYRVLLVDADGEIVHAGETALAEANIPASVELKRGRTYIWTVTGSGPRGARDEASGKFELVDADTDRRYSAALSQAVDPSAQVVLALSLEQTGLRQEAAQLWRTLASAAPQHPVLMERAVYLQRVLSQPR